VFSQSISTGVPGLDDMLGSGGIYRGSSALVSGVSGSGKTILGASFAVAACKRGERCIFFTYEESPEALARNVGSAGIDVRAFVDSGLLHFEATRPSAFGFEMHLAHVQRELDRVEPKTVVVDPVTAFRGAGTEVHALLVRMLDMLKARGITAVFTSLTVGNDRLAQSDFGMSSLMDTWISLVDIEGSGERNRGLYVLKSRGMSHSNQISEYLLTDEGIKLVAPYLGPSGVLTGSARLAKEAEEAAEAQRRREEMEQQRRDIAVKRAVTERRIAELRAEIEAQEAAVAGTVAQEGRREEMRQSDRAAMAVSRGAQAKGEGKRENRNHRKLKT